MNKVAEIKRAELYQKNPLLQAPKDYNALGWRVYELAITDVRPHLKNSKTFDTEFRTLELSARETIKMVADEGSGRNDLYERLKETCEEMVKSYIRIKTEEGFRLFPVFELIEFSSKRGLLVRFNVQMKPFLLELEDGDYTRLKFRNVRVLSSPNAMQLLEHLLQFSYLAKKRNPYYCDISYEELRVMMRLDDKMYVDKKTGKPQKGVFVQKVIRNPVNEINSRLPYHIDFEPLKDPHDKRKTVGWRFWVTLLEKLQTIDAPSTDDEAATTETTQPDVADNPATYEEAHQREYALVNRMHQLTDHETLSLKAGWSLIKKYGYQRTHDNFEYKRNACYKKDGTHPSAAMVVAACRDDYVGQAREAADIKRREKEHEREKALDKKQAAAGIVGGASILQKRQEEQSRNATDESKNLPQMPKADADASEVWEPILKKLRSDGLSESAIEKWLRPCVPVSLSGGVLKIVAANDFVRDWVKGKYLGKLAAAANEFQIDGVVCVSNEVAK